MCSRKVPSRLMYGVASTLVISLLSLVVYNWDLKQIIQGVPGIVEHVESEAQVNLGPTATQPEQHLAGIVKNWPSSRDANGYYTNGTMVLMLSYQRTGSSFLADALFNLNPDAFFLYEPIDPLYAAMFGVDNAVPDDITTYPDGSLRLPSPEEVKAVTWFLEHMMRCDATALPTEVYLHVFWYMFSKTMSNLEPFFKCLSNQQMLGGNALYGCQNHIRPLCGQKFGELGKRQDVCLQQLWKPKDLNVEPQRNPMIPFRKYESCIKLFQRPVEKCLPRFEQQCASLPIHAVKTVRATMHSVEPLLEKYPNFYVIHSFRDPRATVLSRTQLEWARSIFAADGSVDKTAHAYCQTVMADSRKRKELEDKYPGRIKVLVYRDFIADPIAKLHEIYQFLGQPVSPSFEQVFHKRIVTSGSKAIAEKWMVELTPEEIRVIEQECRAFSRELDFGWHVTI